MADLADYARPFEQGITVGAQIGHTIAQNQIAREKMRRDLEQAQISNAIQERHTRLLEADAALKAEQFQQLNDFQKYVDQTTPSGDLFTSMAPADQEQALHTIGEQQVRHLPAALLPRGLESSLSDYEKNQRLQDTLNNLNQRTAVLESGRTTRAAMRGDESTANRFSREESQRLNREAAGARTDTRNEGSMARARFVQGAIDARNVGRAKTDLYPAGTPAALYDELLTAKAAGGQQGAVSNGVYTEGARQGLFTGPQPIDSIIASVVTNVPPATRRKIESKAKLNPEPDQTTPESAPAAEPAAMPVPTQAPGPKEKADMANKIAAENPSWSRAQVLEELAKRLK